MTLRARTGWWLALAVLWLGVAMRAEPIAQLKATGYVNDFAHVLDANSTAQIESICQQIDTKAQAQIAVVTINSLDGVDVESYAVDLFKKWGVGYKSTDRGVLILYAIKDHRARIEVGYGLEPILPDGKVGAFQREAIPQMKSGNYSGALLLVTSRVAEVIAKDKGIQLAGAPDAAPPVEKAREPRMAPQEGTPIGLIIVGVIVLIIVLAVPPLRSLLFWILLSQMTGGRGGGSWGGGGFGGGGGGGGFGGFGGGSSGGGGASSSW